MAYFIVQDFKAGLDRRRMPVTSAPGTLQVLRNAHINRGGEIEKRKAFVPFATLPPGTVGLGAVGGRLYVFGHGVAPSMPPGVAYQQLVSGAGSGLRGILSAQPVNGKLYVIAEYNDYTVRHFYDGAQVTAAAGRPAALTGRIALPFRDKMYVAADTVLFCSGLSTPNDYGEGATGSGLYDMSTQAAGAEAITGIGNYQGRLAVFSRRATQIWDFSADPDAAQQIQVLRNIGTVSPRSVVPFADSDVFFLADSGIRSLRARDASNSAAMSDVGTPIDEDVIAQLRSLPAAAVEAAHGIIEPTDGRFWLALGGQLYVFSYFPGAKVSAWSTYDLPAPSEAMVAVDNRVYLRIGDTVYLYGGVGGEDYDSTEAEVELPFLDGRTVATWKAWRGIDIAAEGVWNLYAGSDPLQPSAEDLIGALNGHSFNIPTVPMLLSGPMVKLRLVSVGPGPAKLGSVVAHYAAGQAS